MATNHLKRPHYDNCVLISQQGKLMTTISLDKVEWYTSRGLGKLVERPGYAKAVQLTFAHKRDSGDENDLMAMPNCCVVCGREDTLSLHHCTPYSVKRHFPLRDKEHTRRLCVLLCETHHLAIEAINQQIAPNPFAPIEGHLTWLNRLLGLYTKGLKKLAVRYWRWRAGGVKAINARYIAVFMSEMKPRYLPKDWLQP